MKILGVNNYNASFGAGNVILDNVNPKYALRYDEIKRIAKNDKLDLKIKMAYDSKNLKDSDLFVVIAQQNIKSKVNDIIRVEKPVYGSSCVLSDKKASAKEVSDKLYETVIKSVEDLAETIKKYTGKKPKFLQYLKR